MRCEEVERELAAPTPGCDRVAMADHLADCPSCAAWAQSAERLDRLWEATRPAEPSAEAWDSVWSGISAALDRPSATPGAGAGAGAGVSPRPQPVLVPAIGEMDGVRAHPRHRPRAATRRWGLGAVALIGLAQAAAILVAFGLAWQPSPRPEDPAPGSGSGAPRVAATPGAPTPIRVDSPVQLDADIDEGYLMVIHAGTAGARVENATPPEMNTGSDGGLVFLNVMESLSTPHVAAR